MDINNLVSFEDTSVAFSSKSDKDLRKMYWLFTSMNNNTIVNLGTSLIKTALNLGFPIRNTIKNTLFEHFCGGESIEEAQNTIRELEKYNIGAILDYSVEGKGNEESYDHALREILTTIDKAKYNENIPFCVFKLSGLGSFELLEKIQKGELLSDYEEHAFGKIKERVTKICQAAHDANVRIFIDAEESWYQDVVDRLAYEMMARYNTKKTIVYNTYQMYRHDMLTKLIQAHTKAKENGYKLGVKLVRGAYHEKERERAKKMGYPDPIHLTKTAVDEDFNQAVFYCVDNRSDISLCLASHNEYSNFYLVLLMEKNQIRRDDPDIWFSQLYGMSDHISFNLAKEGYNVTKYLPYGPLESVIPYLFRRAEENKSIAGQSSRELQLIKKEIRRRKISEKAIQEEFARQA
jgi:proline dehydrogenase